MPERSIHYRRRWFYALWVFLLVLSGLALLVWEMPVRTDTAALQVRIHVTGVPEGTRTQAWAGPWKTWPGKDWTGAGAFGDLAVPPSGTIVLPVVRLSIARRRFNLGYIPRGTWDLVMVKFVPPSGPPRFIALPCSQDIRTGLLRPKYKLTDSIDTSWNNLLLDGNPPNRVP